MTDRTPPRKPFANDGQSIPTLQKIPRPQGSPGSNSSEAGHLEPRQTIRSDGQGIPTPQRVLGRQPAQPVVKPAPPTPPGGGGPQTQHKPRK
jgi:hypothetical protein